jgi:hypothetical protein
MMLVKASKDSEAGAMLHHRLIAALTKDNEEMAKAGILLGLAGVQPSPSGARQILRPARIAPACPGLPVTPAAELERCSTRGWV